MGSFGRCAVLTAQNLQRNAGACPLQAWQLTINHMRLAVSTSRKCCAKYAFLGLCQRGLVRNVVPCGCHIRIGANGQYAIDAARILIQSGIRPTQFIQTALWARVPNHAKTHNQQMDVVISLWNRGLI